MHKLYTLIILTGLYVPVFGQRSVIPFQLTEYNNIAIQVTLNKKDTVHLMFHTASSSVTLTEEAVQKLTSVHFAGADTVKSWGRGDNTSRFSKSNTVQIGDLTWENIPIWEDKYSGQHTDGKFGPELFRQKVVEIDFDKKIIILHRDLPKKTKKYAKLKLTTEPGMMFIESSCDIGDTILKNKFLIHSGYSGSLLLDDDFVAKNRLGEKLKIIDERELKDSFGNILKTKKAILPALLLGNEQLSDVPAGFFPGALGRQKMSSIGGDVLKRFNIIIDAQREYIYLKANHLKNEKYS
jgi:hypothetical protein